MLYKGAYFFGLKTNEFALLAALSFIAMWIISIYYPDQSLWVYFGLAFTTFVLGNVCLAANQFIILPELISFISCVNWIVAPWISYLYPPHFQLYKMSVRPEEYFSYIVPCAVALWLGVHLPLRAAKHRTETIAVPLNKKERQMMDALIIFGLIVSYASAFLPKTLNFLYYILAELRFVGALCYLFTRTKGWLIRIIIVYATLFLVTVQGGVFYEIILWSGYLFISLAYLYKWKWRMPFYLIIGFIILNTFNLSKPEYRAYILKYPETSLTKKIGLFSDIYLKVLTHKNRDTAEVSEQMVRWNQGWIISRLMFMVPAYEPFAQGETIVTAIVASVVPRIFFPNKLGSGSREVFFKYTGISLGSSTSMAFGTAGEMYINFGRLGGVLCMLCYGLMVGFIYSRFARLAKKEVLWWAWVPLVLLTTIEAEWNLVDVLNHIVKSLAVMIAFIYFFPVYKNKLSKNIRFRRKFVFRHRHGAIERPPIG